MQGHLTVCYSAQIERDYGRYLRVVGPENALNREDFVRKYWERQTELPQMKIPKAVDAWFVDPKNGDEQKIAACIEDFNDKEIAKLEQEVFKQRKRLADAERGLAIKETKKARNDQRIASNKVEWALGKLGDIKRSDFKPRDARIYPGWFAPVIVSENGKAAVKLMRYQCRPAGKPKFFDSKYPGTYNARRDSLGGFWKDVFGYQHGIMLATTFFENVSKHKVEQRELTEGEKEENVVLEFKPRGLDTMFVACLWSHWEEGGASLDSFAAITDEPPAEVAAAGHDRCIIPIKEENIAAWLNPDAKNLNAMQAILEDRARPYYEYRMAA
jgi:putative SOS response-associated peptidase YedK